MRSPRSPSGNPLDLFLRLLSALFGGGRGGKQRAALIAAGVIALCLTLTAVFYVFQPQERKAEINQIVRNYADPRKHVRLSEALWEIWSLYFRRDAARTAPETPGPATTTTAESVLGGEPERTSFPDEVRVLRNTAYLVGYCEDLANPAWVSYRVFQLEGHPKPARRPPGFIVDTRTTARVEPGDYIGSGYDRGHMAPNYAIGTRYGPDAQEETFLMSNICPQRHRLNAGLWKDLEIRIADQYTARYGQVWVIDGPVFGPEDRLQRLRGRVPVPVAFYMIVARQDGGGVQAEAFIMDQEAPAHGSLAPYLTSVREIEQRTGLNFFPKLDRDLQDRLETRKLEEIW